MGTAPQSAGGDDGRRRTRRRRRPASPADMPEHAPAQADSAATPADMPVHAQREPTDGGGGPNNRRAGSRNDRDSSGESARRADSKMEKAERGLRGLIGAGPSQLSISAATRARDAARPTDQDLAAADKLPIVRRNYIPPSGEISR